jgi:hypothetical protein
MEGLEINYDSLRDSSLEKCGERYKRQFPQYKDYTAGEIARALQIKNGWWQGHYYANTVDLLEYYDPRIGRFRAWWRRLKSEGRGKLQEKLSEELQHILGQAVAIEDAVINGKRKVLDLQRFIAENERLFSELRYHEGLFEKAVEEGHTVEGLNQKNLDRVRSENYIAEQESATDNRIKLEQALLEIRLTEFKELEAIKLNNELKMAQERVRLGFMVESLSTHQQIMMVQEMLDSIYKQIEEIDASDHLLAPTRRRMIQDREQIISHLKRYRNAEGKSLND